VKFLNFFHVLNFKIQKKQKNSGGGLAQNPKILEVNLIKDEMQVSFNLRKHFSTLLFSLFVATLFVVEIYLGLNWWSAYEEDRLAQAQIRFNALSEEIRKMKTTSDQISAFRQRVELADALLSRHVYWTNFFTWLEANTLSSVSYQNFSGGSDGEYNLEATTDNFRDISWQTRLLLADPAVLSVRVDEGGGDRDLESADATKNTEKIEFNLQLKVKPSIFNDSDFVDSQ